MISMKPLLISSKGGTINCLKGDSVQRIYQSCSSDSCIYSSDLHTVKLSLDNLEGANNILQKAK